MPKGLKANNGLGPALKTLAASAYTFSIRTINSYPPFTLK